MKGLFALGAAWVVFALLLNFAFWGGLIYLAIYLTKTV